MTPKSYRFSSSRFLCWTYSIRMNCDAFISKAAASDSIWAFISGDSRISSLDSFTGGLVRKGYLLVEYFSYGGQREGESPRVVGFLAKLLGKGLLLGVGHEHPRLEDACGIAERENRFNGSVLGIGTFHFFPPDLLCLVAVQDSDDRFRFERCSPLFCFGLDALDELLALVVRCLVPGSKGVGEAERGKHELGGGFICGIYGCRHCTDSVRYLYGRLQGVLWR